MNITIGSKVKDDEQNVYVLDSVLGEGGFGCVYKAHREKDGYVVAVKTLLSSFASQEAMLSFNREINQAKLIDSKYAIKYIYIHDGTIYNEYPPYIIMEYADGGTLADIIETQRNKGKPFDLEFIYDAMLQLSKGMCEISKYIVHRDIKPENVLIENNVFKISDFGLSKNSGDSTKTNTFKGYGTAKYMPPEGWKSDENTVQMDIYSMGIVFYEIATLNYPYSLKQNPTHSDYRDAHLYKAPENPIKYNLSLPQNLVSVLIKMIEKPTQKRFKNWDDIIKSINKVQPTSDNIGIAVTRALTKRNEADLIEQSHRVAKEKAIKEREEHINLIYSQYKITIFNPIDNFIREFNNQYSGDRKFSINKTGLKAQKNFSLKITTPSFDTISIETEIVFPENFQKRVPKDRIFFEDSEYRIINYTPKCQNRDVLAWSQVTDSKKTGFNLLLLKANDSLYGDWYVLTNKNNLFSTQPRPEPFGFTLKELPENIIHLNATHIYELKLDEFNESILFDYLAEHVQ